MVASVLDGPVPRRNQRTCEIVLLNGNGVLFGEPYSIKLEDKIGSNIKPMLCKYAGNNKAASINKLNNLTYIYC